MTPEEQDNRDKEMFLRGSVLAAGQPTKNDIIKRYLQYTAKPELLTKGMELARRVFETCKTPADIARFVYEVEAQRKLNRMAEYGTTFEETDRTDK